MTLKIDRIRDTLLTLSPTHLEVLDESHAHSRGLETHYKVVIASDAFDGKRLLAALPPMGQLDDELQALDWLSSLAFAH